MADWQLPSELQQLERDLANRSLSAASTGLRQRVLDDVRSRLRVERWRDRWQFAMAVAAAALLWMNFSTSAAQDTDFGLRRKASTESIAMIAQHIHETVPEFSSEEARRRAILLQAGSNLICFPALSEQYDLSNRINAWRLSRPQEDQEKRGE